MAIRLTGLNSGLDTDSMVEALVSAYATKKDNYVKAQTKLEWTMSTWKDLNSKVYSFYTTTLSPMQYSSGYNLKTASVSDSTVASVKASSDAVASTQTLTVSQLATSGYMTGGKVTAADGSASTANTKLSELGITDATLKVNDTFITLNGDMTLSGLATKLKQAGVNASFDAANQRFFVSSSASGADGEFTLTAGNVNGIDALQKLGLYAATDVNGNDTAEISYYKQMAVADEDSVVAERYDKQKYTTSTYTEYVQGLINTAETNKTAAETSLAKLTADDYDWSKDYESEEDYQKAVDNLQAKVDGYQKTIDDNQTLLDDPDALEASMATANQAIEDKIRGQVQDEIATAQKVVNEGIYTNSGDAARITARDAIIQLNGATFTGSTNTFSINGLTIDVKNTTSSPVTITTSLDTQGIYDRIKSFFSGYNELIGSLDTLYYAESADGYEPLTTDEKDAMTDTQIEEWEEKVKASLLRKDSTLGSLSTAMKNVFLSTTTEYNGVKYNLASFGIATGSYFSTEQADRGKFHIDGDPDDATTSSSADKLMAAIANDPEGVMEYFQTLSQNLYDTLSKKMSSSSISSAFTIYNDKQMSSQYSEYKQKVTDWEDKLETIRETYYQKFAAMESALATLQSQTSALSSLFGS